MVAIGYFLSGIGYPLLALGLALAGRRSSGIWPMVIAFVVHGAWAISALVGSVSSYLTLDFAHFAAWTIYFANLHRGSRVGIAGSLAILVGLVVPFALLAARPAALAWVPVQAEIALLTIAAVTALIFAASAFRNAEEEIRFFLKFFCLPLAALFAYDLFIYANALALAPPAPFLVSVRGLLSAICLPVFIFGMVRARFWRQHIELSHQAAVYSTALIVTGIYFAVVALMAYIAPRLAGRIGPELQIVFLFGSTLLVIVLMATGAVRARLRFFIARHFLKRKYDYRHEWQKFMHTMASDVSQLPIEQRIIKAVSDLVEVPGGALWSFENARPRLLQTWNFRAGEADVAAVRPGRLRDPDGALQIVDGAELARLVPEGRGIWLLVPLPHGDEPVGFLTLAAPRARHAITWEDRELIMLIARQCAHYLEEHRVLRKLEEGRQFDRFSRQYAFVVHDVKNLVSQIAVLLRNAERHWDNPEFRDDFQSTLRDALDRMNALIDRIAAINADDGAGEQSVIILHEVVAAHVARLKAGCDAALQLRAAPGIEAVQVRIPSGRVTSLLDHLVANAAEAAGPEGHVTVALDADERSAVIDVIDDGPGMSAEFVRTRLFRPFHSTKGKGLGMGTYQCREIAREHGGDLDVISSPASGTTMRVWLPLARAAEPMEIAS